MYNFTSTYMTYAECEDLYSSQNAEYRNNIDACKWEYPNATTTIRLSVWSGLDEIIIFLYVFVPVGIE